MVIWCRSCGALMGIHEPYIDWRVDRNALCPLCAAREKLIELDGKKINVDGKFVRGDFPS